MNQKSLVLLVVAILLVGGVATYIALSNDNKNSDGTIVDAAGRSVAVPEDLSGGIVTAGPGALRFVSYFGDVTATGTSETIADSVVMVDKGDAGSVAGGSSNQGGKTYQYAYEYYLNADLKWHTHNAIENTDMASILEIDPSVIVVTDTVYNTYKSNCDQLATAYTLIVVYELTDFFDYDSFTVSEKFEGQITNLGKLFKAEDRAKELIDGTNDILLDIDTIVGNNVSTKGVFLAGVAYGGAKTLVYSTGDFSSLKLVNGSNVVSSSVSSVSEIPISDILSYNIDIVLVDPLYKVDATSTTVQAFLEDVSNVDKYVILPYFWFGQNLENILGNAYFLADLLYEDITVDYAQKITEINTLFLGEKGASAFDNMNAWSSGNTKNGASMELLTEVTLTS